MCLQAKLLGGPRARGATSGREGRQTPRYGFQTHGAARRFKQEVLLRLLFHIVVVGGAVEGGIKYQLRLIFLASFL